MISRRQFLRGVLTVAAGTTALGGYAVAEPWRLTVTRYSFTPPKWPPGFTLRCAVLADLHVCEPWMGEARLRQIVARTNALNPDVTLLLGDYVAGWGMSRWSHKVPDRTWSQILAGLSAPQGVHAVLGNHDWWDDNQAQERQAGPVAAKRALISSGIPVYENDVVRLVKNGQPFWVGGLGDQWAFWARGAARQRRHFIGVDNLPGLVSKVTDEAPLVLMAHEPDIFPQVPDRVALTVSGHTHGGQVTIAGYAPVVPSRYGRRFVYGHVVEQNRNLIVSGGLGCSGWPVRLGRPPEIVLIELGGEASVS